MAHNLVDPWAVAIDKKIQVREMSIRQSLNPVAREAVASLLDMGLKLDPDEYTATLERRLENHFLSDDTLLCGFPLEEQGIRFAFLEERLVPALKRWTLAHEIGHLAKGYYDDDGDRHYCSDDEADQFAAELLIPEDTARRAVLAVGPDLASLFELFGLPNEPERVYPAVTRRLVALGLIDASLGKDGKLL